MYQLNLNNYLARDNIDNIILLSTAEDSFALMDYLIMQFQHKIGNATMHKFTADRYFSYASVFDVINSGNLFNNITYIEINYKTKPTADQQKDILNLLSKLDKQTFILITTDKLTKTDNNAAWVKVIAEMGLAINITDSLAPEIIRHQLNASNITISNKALDLLLELNQGNLSQVLQETNKLALLFPAGYEITYQDIQADSLDNSLYNIYQLSNAYLSGSLSQCLTILNSFYQKPEDAILLQWLIGEDIKKIIRLKAKMQQNYTFSQVAGELKIWGSNSNLYQNASRRLNYSLLVATLEDLANLDMATKGLVDNNIKLQLINILTKLCGK